MGHKIRAFRIRWRATWSAYRKDYAEAARQYQEVLALEGDNSFELSLVASYLEHECKDDEALEAAQRVFELDADDYTALKTVARICAKRGEYHRAKDYTVRSLRNLPDLSSSKIFYFLYLLLKFVSVVPGLRNRLNLNELNKLQNPDLYTHEWREWACHYLDWYSKEFEGNDSQVVH